TVLAAEGFIRYGHTGAARRLLEAVLSAALRLPNHRLPELFAGHARRDSREPLAYPDASAPQSWAAAATLRACELLDHLRALPATRDHPPVHKIAGQSQTVAAASLPLSHAHATRRLPARVVAGHSLAGTP